MFVAPSDTGGLNGTSQRSILRTVLEDLSSLKNCDIFVQTEKTHVNWVRECVPDQDRFFVRTDGPSGRDALPRKVQEIVRDHFCEGYEKVLSVAADTPGLNADRIRQGLRTLEGDEPRAVVGPSTDGGFYLLGINQYKDELFRDVPFYVENTYKSLKNRLKQLYSSIRTLDRLSDVDRASDWFSVGPRWLKPYRWLLGLLQRIFWVPAARGDEPVRAFRRITFLSRSYRSPPYFLKGSS